MLGASFARSAAGVALFFACLWLESTRLFDLAAAAAIDAARIGLYSILSFRFVREQGKKRGLLDLFSAIDRLVGGYGGCFDFSQGF